MKAAEIAAGLLAWIVIGLLISSIWMIVAIAAGLI